MKTWLLMLACLFLIPALLHAQSTRYTISGIVVDTDAGEPLAGANISIQNLVVGTAADAEGNFELVVNLNPGTYTLNFSFVGFKRIRRDITLGDESSVNVGTIEMEPDIIGSEEVVITGTSVLTSKKQLGNSISTVSGKDIEESGATSIDRALSGKISGAQITQNSGNPAGGISVRLRGTSTVNGSSEPLYIIDGVIVNNDSPQLIDLGGYAQNRLADLNPNDIDRIEVIKGAAAAAIYGSRASNGVVQIFTKRGSQSKSPQITFSTNFKVNELRKKIPYNQVPLLFANPADNSDFSTVEAQRFDYQDYFFNTGLGVENYLSVSGGSGNTRYFLSGSRLNNEGIIRNTDFQRTGGRLRLDQTINQWASVSLGANYTFSESREIPNGGINQPYGALTGFVFSQNTIDARPEFGVYPVTSLLVARTNPREAVDRFDFGQKINRFIGDFQVNLIPFRGFGVDLIFGVDTYTQSATALIPPNNTSPNPDGFARTANLTNLQLNTDLNLRYATDLSPSVTSTSSGGFTLQYDESESIGITSNKLSPITKTTDAGSITGRFDIRSERVIEGAFVQQTFGFVEKIFITGAARIDASSAFGENDRWQFYPKASASYLISEESFWKNSPIANTVSSFKLRASVGQAGNLTGIGAFDRFTNYNPVPISGKTGLLPSSSLGTPDIKPERQTEVEFGTDIALFNNRVGYEFTYYNKEVEDLLLDRTLSPSTGFDTRLENVGTMTNQGFEMSLTGVPIQNNDWRVSFTAIYSQNRNEVDGIEGDILQLPGSFGVSVAKNKEPLGVFFFSYYARNEDGSLLLTPQGLPQREREGRDADGQPTGAVLNRVIGDPNPDYIASLISEVDYKKFSFRVQFDAVQGFDVFNFTSRVMNNRLFGGGERYGQELSGELPKGLNNAEVPIFEAWIEDGSFIKLRELSLSYATDVRALGLKNLRFSLIGRNLFSIDDYSGQDPEVNAAGQSTSVRGFDFAEVPIPRTYSLGITANF